MVARYLLLGPALVLAALSASACTSRDERAATAAGIAANALQEGNIPAARFQIGQALAARDDVSDYWLLSARIALAEGNFAGAFDAYESALTLDRGNVEALTRLCQLAASGNQPERAERYADQLLALHPGENAAINVQAAIALSRGDKKKAAELLGRVLAADPADPTALMIRSRLFLANDDYANAARAAEASLAAPGDPVGRLSVLKDIYVRSKDVAGYRRTIARLARAAPTSPQAQLEYADSLYEAGDAASAFAVTRRVLALKPGDIATAGAVLQLWMAQGSAAMPAGAIVAAAAGTPLENRATFAAYANGVGQPALAMQVLGDAAESDPPSTANADAKAARAQAQLLLGQRDAAAATIAAVLAADPDQPRALAVRASLRADAGDRDGAVEDLRHVLSTDPDNASIRLALAEQQAASGDRVLAIATLHDGLHDAGADPRLATRLAETLRAQGQNAEAKAVIESYVRKNPFSRRPAA